MIHPLEKDPKHSLVHPHRGEDEEELDEAGAEGKDAAQHDLGDAVTVRGVQRSE
jgi:hypothetical protein